MSTRPGRRRRPPTAAWLHSLLTRCAEEAVSFTTEVFVEWTAPMSRIEIEKDLHARGLPDLLGQLRGPGFLGAAGYPPHELALQPTLEGPDVNGPTALQD